ncbi:MAG: hypothetical protein PV340_00710 [Wolbachia sp.]|nr:hypothetical protein [Wolbachia sp.]MDD9335904.1 hypothetical protein [Wolbachia sp.]
MTNPKNIHYVAPQEENIYVLNHDKKGEEEYKNTACKLILGVFILSVGFLLLIIA